MFTKRPLILASKSPRRKQLLQAVSPDFQIITQNTAETYPTTLPIAEVAPYIATQKALAVQHHLKEDSVVVAADTIVCLGNIIFGKPKDRQDAINIIQQLSGKRHQVITGICLLDQTKQHHFAVTTQVYFKTLSLEQIDYYVTQFRPYDKAGAYAIQEWIGMVGIEKIEGCYFNVVGLPVSRLITELHNHFS